MYKCMQPCPSVEDIEEARDALMAHASDIRQVFALKAQGVFLHMESLSSPIMLLLLPGYLS